MERYVEDGVEVIVNHLEPYKIPGELTTLAFEDEIVVKLEIHMFTSLIKKKWL